MANFPVREEVTERTESICETSHSNTDKIQQGHNIIWIFCHVLVHAIDGEWRVL